MKNIEHGQGFNPDESIAIPVIGEKRDKSLKILNDKYAELIQNRDPYKSPEQEAFLVYVLTILDNLRGDLSVQLSDIRPILAKKYGEVDEDALKNAFDEIKKLVENA